MIPAVTDRNRWRRPPCSSPPRRRGSMSSSRPPSRDSGPLGLPRRCKRSVAEGVRPVTAGCTRLPVQGWAPASEAVKKSDLSDFALAVRAHPVAPDLIRGPSLIVCACRSRSRKDWTAWAGRERPGWAPDQVLPDSHISARWRGVALPQPSPRPPSRGPASVLTAAPAVRPALHRLRRHRKSGMGPRLRGDDEKGAKAHAARTAGAPQTSRNEMCACGRDQVRGDGVCPDLSPFRTADCRSDFFARSFAGETIRGRGLPMCPRLRPLV